jgi:cytochrome c oxidase subunit 3
LIFVGSQAWEWKNFIKGEYGAIETGGSLLQFVDKEGNRSSSRFCCNLHEEREQLTRNKGKWFMERKVCHLFHCRSSRFKAVLTLIRTEVMKNTKTR